MSVVSVDNWVCSRSNEVVDIYHGQNIASVVIMVSSQVNVMSVVIRINIKRTIPGWHIGSIDPQK